MCFFSWSVHGVYFVFLSCLIIRLPVVSSDPSPYIYKCIKWNCYRESQNLHHQILCHTVLVTHYTTTAFISYLNGNLNESSKVWIVMCVSHSNKLPPPPVPLRCCPAWTQLLPDSIIQLGHWTIGALVILVIIIVARFRRFYNTTGLLNDWGSCDSCNCNCCPIL